MKKMILVVLAILLFVSIIPSKAVFAEEANSAAAMSIKDKAEKAAKKLATFGEFYGWTAEVGKPTVSESKAVVKVTLHNSKYVWSNIAVTATANKVTYKYKGNNYSLASWKIVLKQYKVSKDIVNILKKKVRTNANDLAKYAKARGWSVKRTRTNNGSKTATETLEFHNGAYQFKATVILKRGSEKFKFAYKRDDAPSTKKDIKNWLEVYKAPSQ